MTTQLTLSWPMSMQGLRAQQTLLRALANIDVPGTEPGRPRHRLLLVLKRRARQIEVHLVLAGLLLLSWKKPDPEPGVIARQERDAVLGVVGAHGENNARRRGQRRLTSPIRP